MNFYDRKLDIFPVTSLDGYGVREQGDYFRVRHGSEVARVRRSRGAW